MKQTYCSDCIHTEVCAEKYDEEYMTYCTYKKEFEPKQEILNLYYGMSDSMQKAVKDVMSVTQKVV